MTENPIMPNQEIPNSLQEKFLNLLIRPVPARKHVVLKTKSEIMVDVSREVMALVLFYFNYLLNKNVIINYEESLFINLND